MILFQKKIPGGIKLSEGRLFQGQVRCHRLQGDPHRGHLAVRIGATVRHEPAHRPSSGVEADVTFQVGDETFAAHRLVLGARSFLGLHGRAPDRPHEGEEQQTRTD